MYDETRQHVRSHALQRELEAGHDTEVAAAAADRPEEVLVLGLTGVQQRAVRDDDVGAHQMVDGHAVLAREPAETAAEREAGNTGGGVDAERDRERIPLRDRVELGERAAGLDHGNLVAGVDVHVLHQRQVDDDAAVAECAAGNVVAAAAHGDEQLVLSGEADDALYVTRVDAAYDHRGFAVDHRVPDAAGLVVVRRFPRQ